MINPRKANAAKDADQIIIIGGGPAGLMAAERLSAAGCAVTLYEQMPTVGRKFLMAGRGGLNLTHSEPLDDFLRHYGPARPFIEPMIRAFTPDDLRAWADGLGAETFIGSSGRVFPKAMKASPLLRAWLLRLSQQGVVIKTRHRCLGWDETGALLIEDLTAPAPASICAHRPRATLFAMGGASWPRLGSDGAWARWIEKQQITLSPLGPANCGFERDWSPFFRDKFAGHPLKPCLFSIGDHSIKGEAMITAQGLEGGAIYGLGPVLRQMIAEKGTALLKLDLCPDLELEDLHQKIRRTRRSNSLSNRLRKAASLSPQALSLLRESPAWSDTFKNDPHALAAFLKNLPLPLDRPRPIDKAISTYGGVKFINFNENGFINTAPKGVFCAGEMLDWEAPTGGYLLQACFSSALWAAGNLLNNM
ncbi:NAD(FAD)-utilizing dehydrogenase [Iodidimonas nitroreducens]|uniref:NAD(FAD)-utilizing dehydrogenase n=1 Tax=Iodidimonas nitroreducens TaxID=1236968 RepID=A0A5A7N689_9PROT|nr:TIGR03862 family flavoprotein [Iodidimonas nitroreducens]GAK32965.1 putative protein [alpha proteobacterium Q-1]GER03145.1 NAD(FAD)-utilizing dehydrogenase [Iodidimonas nitroreducens]